jgi:DNA-binding transcriptional MerR regulator
VRDTGQPAPSRPAKSAAAFRTIGEVAGELDLPQHVLRFWESKFPQLQPVKRVGGRRYYRPEDVLLLRRIQQCLHRDGYTIRGVQRLLDNLSGGAPAAGAARSNGTGIRRGGTRSVATAMPSLFPLDAAPDPPDGSPPPPSRNPRRRPAKPDAKDQNTRESLEAIRRELLEARALLDELLRRPKPF